MWTRRELKDQAKFNLRGKYWMAFAVSLIVAVLGGGTSYFSWQFDTNDIRRLFGDTSQGYNFYDQFDNFSSADWSRITDIMQKFFTSGVFLAIILFGVFACLFAIAFRLFVSYAVQVGGNRWFSRSRESAATPVIGQVFSLFRRGSYLKTVGSMFWMSLFLFLWGLLAAVPTIVSGILMLTQVNMTDALRDLTGSLSQNNFKSFFEGLGSIFIQLLPYMLLGSLASLFLSIPFYVKTYSYRLTPWILADNPQIGYRRALKLSMDLTRGHKLNIWVLDLSFIGWFILGAMACGVGALFVMPYYNAVQAELYATLRQNGVSSGLCTMEELGYIKVEPAVPANPEQAAY